MGLENTIKQAPPDYRVLIVDDEYKTSNMVYVLIGGYLNQKFKIDFRNLSKAIGVDEAVSKILAAQKEGHPYNLVISDFNMDGKDGGDGTDLIRRIDSELGMTDLPVIIQSGDERNLDDPGLVRINPALCRADFHYKSDDILKLMELVAKYIP